jgi:hypothetical protein
MAHAVQMMKGDQPPVWLVEGGAVHLDCLLNKKLSSSSTSYSRMMTSEGGIFSNGIIEGFLAYYASPHGQSTGLKGGETWCDSETPCGTADTVATINAGATLIHGMQVNAQLLFYHVGAIATAWAIHNANKTSATLWQSSSEGFWNAITPWDGYGGNGWTSDCPEDKGWKKAFTSFSGHDDMDAFYSAFHAWATTATESDVLAILEPDEDVEAMYSGAFQPAVRDERNRARPVRRGGRRRRERGRVLGRGRARRLDRHLGRHRRYRRGRERNLRRRWNRAIPDARDGARSRRDAHHVTRARRTRVRTCGEGSSIT